MRVLKVLLLSCAIKETIEQHGVRRGWQPFGVWSLRKAQEQARVETARLKSATSRPRRSKQAEAISESSTDSEK